MNEAQDPGGILPLAMLFQDIGFDPPDDDDSSGSLNLSKQETIWSIPHFSESENDSIIISPTTTIQLGNYDSNLETSMCYRLALTPKVQNSNNMQITLYLEGPEMKLSYNICLLNENKIRKFHHFGTGRIGTNITKTFEAVFDRAEVMDEDNGVLSNDTLKVSCILHSSETTTSSTSNEIVGATESQKQMGKFLHTQAFSDVVITAQEKKFKAHKIVLSLHSPVFEAMFSHDMKEVRDGNVNITDITPKAVERMLEFMYDGSVPLTIDENKELLIVANKYGIKKLKKACEGVLGKHLTNATAIETLIFADINEASFLKDTCIKYIAYKIRQMTSLPTWFSFVSDNPELATAIILLLSEEVDLSSSPSADDLSSSSSPLPCDSSPIPRPSSPTPPPSTPLPLFDTPSPPPRGAQSDQNILHPHSRRERRQRNN